MIAQQLTIEATTLTNNLWFARLTIEKQMETENDTNKVIDLIAKWTRIQDAENKALERMARRLAKQVDEKFDPEPEDNDEANPDYLLDDEEWSREAEEVAQEAEDEVNSSTSRFSE